MKEFCEIKESDLVEVDTSYRHNGIFEVFKVKKQHKEDYGWSPLESFEIGTLYFDLIDCEDWVYSSVGIFEDISCVKSVYRKDGKDYKCIWERG